MGRKRIAGLQKLGDIWHIDKRVNGQRICESTGTSNLEEAEKYLVKRLETIRQAKVYGIRAKRTFRDGAIKYLMEKQHKKSLFKDAEHLKILEPFIGDLLLEDIHMGVLQPYIEARKQQGLATRTINHGLKVVRHLLNLAVTEWIDEHGLTWLRSSPKIKLMPEHDLRKPYPLSWEEQESLFAVVPEHLREMVLFAVNTGCRDQEICKLRWEWEVSVPIKEVRSVFIIPSDCVKNREDRLVVLNHLARSVIERQRGKHPEFVFVYRDKPLYQMSNTGWDNARAKTEIPVRIHDLKHTFGRRLRAAGVSFEDRQDLLGHKSSRITTHYSSAELLNLWEATNRVCEQRVNSSLTVLRQVKNPIHEKFTKCNFTRVDTESETKVNSLILP